MEPVFRSLEDYDNEIENLRIEHNPEPIPALSALCYRYDYGDDWEIRITCTNAWYDRSVYARDKDGNMFHDFESDRIAMLNLSDQTRNAIMGP